MKKTMLSLAAFFLALFCLFNSSFAQGGDLKIGFVYVGPIGDTGWNYAHEKARLELAKKEPEIETIVVANVSAQDAEDVMENLIEQGARAIFANSFDFGPAIEFLAQKYRDVHFFHCSGTVSGPNITTYFGRMYETIYLSGVLAAMVSKTNHIGFLGPKCIPETLRHLNAFVLGARKIKPEIVIESEWTHDWYAPEKASQLVKRFAKKGVDVFFSADDSAAPLQIAMAEGIYAIGYNADLSKFSPRNILTSAVWNWDVFYGHFITSLKKGTWQGTDIWWGLDRNAIRLSPFSEAVPRHVVQRINHEQIAIANGQLSVFKGPIFDRNDRLRIQRGSVASDKEMRHMDWPIHGIQAKFPEEKINPETIKAYIVQSYEDNHVCGVPQEQGIKAQLEKEYKGSILIKTHYMNTKTINSDAGKMQAEARMVLEEIDNFKPDIVFTIDDNAFREVGLELAGKSFPVIFSGMNGQPVNYNQKAPFLNAAGGPISNISGVYEKLHIQTALNVMRAVLPDLKKVVALLDKSATGKAIGIQLKKELSENKGDIDMEFRSVGTMKEYVGEIEKINGDPTIQAVYPVVLSIKNDSGESIGFKVTIKEFLKKSKKPAMALNFAFAKLGFFGGASVDFSAMGSQAGKIGCRLLQGENIQGLPIQSAQEYLITFNKSRADMLGVMIPMEIISAAVLYNKMTLLPDYK